MSYNISLKKIDLKNHNFTMVLKWFTDPEVMKYMGFYKKVANFKTADQAKAFCKELKDGIFFGIYSGKKLIGQTTLSGFKGKTCKFGILIGEKGYWGKGIGTEVTKMMADYAFNELGIEKVLLDTAAKNIAGQKAYEKAGFKVEKISKNERTIIINGKELADDTVVMVKTKN